MHCNATCSLDAVGMWTYCRCTQQWLLCILIMLVYEYSLKLSVISDKWQFNHWVLRKPDHINTIDSRPGGHQVLFVATSNCLRSHQTNKGGRGTDHQYASLMSPNEGETAVCGSSIALFVRWLGRRSPCVPWPWINCIDLVKLALYTQWLLPLITDAPNWLKCINPSCLSAISYDGTVSMLL